jgi:hypothetical protein
MPRHEYHPRADAGEPHSGKIVMKRGANGRLQIVAPTTEPPEREPEEPLPARRDPPAEEGPATPPSP